MEVTRLVRNTARLREVVAILAKYGLADWLDGTSPEWARSFFEETRTDELRALSREERIRRAITELGTTFIKLGQVLSTRPDLVGMQLADELAELRTGTPADEADVVKQIIADELDGAVDELYQDFDGQALASASIGQVHRATLKDGTQVVVKVQHPGIEERIRNDLEILARLAELAEKYAAELRQYRPSATVADFSRTLMRELDFRSELRNLERFRRNFAENPQVQFPKPYSDLSSQRVLTMDMLAGINMSDGAALREADLDLEQLAKDGANLFVEMIFRDAFYHADPHPGNLMVVVEPAPNEPSATAPQAPQTRIAVLDCGMVGRLDEGLREDIEAALLSIVHGETETIVNIIMRRGDTPDDLNIDELRFDVEDFLSEYTMQSIDEFDLSGCLNGIVDIIRRHKIVLPTPIAMLLKVLIMLEGTAQQLSPRFNLAELIEPYGRQSIQEKFSPQRLWKRMGARYRDWDQLVEILPRDLADILHRLRKGSFDVQLSHRGLETTVNRLVTGILTAALFLGSTLLLSQRVPPTAWGLSIPGALGSAVAIWLGYRLMRQVKKSGHDSRR